MSTQKSKESTLRFFSLAHDQLSYLIMIKKKRADCSCRQWTAGSSAKTTTTTKTIPMVETCSVFTSWLPKKKKKERLINHVPLQLARCLCCAPLMNRLQTNKLITCLSPFHNEQTLSCLCSIVSARRPSRALKNQARWKKKKKERKKKIGASPATCSSATAACLHSQRENILKPAH